MAGEVQIKNSNNGNIATVDSDGRLKVLARTESIQHSISHDEGQSYQLTAATAVTTGTTILAHIKNTDTRDLIITFIRHQIVDASGGTAFPSVASYFRVGIDSTYTSGGTVSSPVNANTGSGNEADAITYTANPTVGGTLVELDRWYTKAEGDMNTYDKQGSLIIPQNKTFELAYLTDHSATVNWRMSFLFSAS